MLIVTIGRIGCYDVTSLEWRFSYLILRKKARCFDTMEVNYSSRSSQSYKWCIVPSCKSTTITTPDKIFVTVPSNQKMRKAWIDAVRREKEFSVKSVLFVCQDHFNLEEDVDNLMEHKMIGTRLRLKKNIVPHKFDCFSSKKPISLKARKRILKRVTRSTAQKATSSSDTGRGLRRHLKRKAIPSQKLPQRNLEDGQPSSDPADVDFVPTVFQNENQSESNEDVNRTMSQDPVYPVGLFYVGTSNEGESAILPVAEPEKTTIVPDQNPQLLPGGITIKQERIDIEEHDEQSTFTPDTASASTAETWNPNIEVKQEDKSGSESLPVVTSVYSTAATNDKEGTQDKDAPEDRNSESYWEKRKKFTLAFAAGLRKFIQMHPELLRYGPKDEASVESNYARCEKCVACLRTEDCGKCPVCMDFSKYGARSKTRKICVLRSCLHTPPKETPSECNSSVTVATPDTSRSQNLLGKRPQEESVTANTSTEDRPSKRERIGEQSIIEDISLGDSESTSTAYVLPPGVTIKEEPPDSE